VGTRRILAPLCPNEAPSLPDLIFAAGIETKNLGQGRPLAEQALNCWSTLEKSGIRHLQTDKKISGTASGRVRESTALLACSGCKQNAWGTGKKGNGQGGKLGLLHQKMDSMIERIEDIILSTDPAPAGFSFQGHAA